MMNTAISEGVTLEDNFVAYEVHLGELAAEEKSGAGVANALSENVHAELLKMRSFVDACTQNYLWHREPFHLKQHDPISGTTPPVFHGKTRFGDCIDDEWFIVYLLREISREFPQAIIRVWDNDGEFLLIEAALVLPKWIRPENSQHRLFLHAGHVHLITTQPSKPLPLVEAVKMVQDASANTRAADVIENAIFERIRGYPDLARAHCFQSNCILPRDIARILANDPHWIAHAVEAFYGRDMISLRACQKMHHFPPSSAVFTTIRITKTMYAQMASQKFHAPKTFLLDENWRQMLSAGPAEQEHKWADLGMKLACGFEILMTDKMYSPEKYGRRQQESKEHEAETVTPLVNTYAFDRDTRWHGFLLKLKRVGYFGEHREDSKLYRERLEKAKVYFVESIVAPPVSAESTDNEYRLYSPQTDIPMILQASRKEFPSEDAFDAYLRDHGFWEMQELDDSWMHVHPEEVERILRERSGGVEEMYRGKEKASENKAEEGGFDLQTMLNTFSEFMRARGGLEGVDDLDAENADEMLANMESYLRQHQNQLEADPDLSSGDSDCFDPTSGEDEEEDEREDCGKYDPCANNKAMFSEYFEEMDRQLYDTKVADGFERIPVEQDAQDDLTVSSAEDDDENESEDEQRYVRKKRSYRPQKQREPRPIDVDTNLAKNLLHGFSAQQGQPGPIGNLLGNLGIVLPRDEDEEEFQE